MSDDDDLSFYLYLVIVIIIRGFCALACHDPNSESEQNRTTRVRGSGRGRRGGGLAYEAIQRAGRANGPRQVARLTLRRGTNSSGDPVALVLVSLINESECAFAKETLQDGHEDFEYFSASQGDERSDRLKACVKSGNWRALKDELSQLSSQSADDRGFYFQVVASAVQEDWPATRTEDLASFSPMLDDWVREEPDNTDCRILRADIGADWAWHARSSSLAHTVSNRQWELFYDRLVAAASELMTARSVCISDPLIYSTAVPMKMGLGKKSSKDLVPFTVRDGLNIQSNEPYFCKKWHGSHQQMFKYAREITDQLPDGHPLWVLIPRAHVERVMIEKVANYWKRTNVRNEIINSFRRAFPGEAVTTIQAKSAAEKSREWTSRNYFAFCLAATGHVQEARSQIRIIGKRPISSWPWCGLERYKDFVEAFGFDTDPQDANDARIEYDPTRPADEEMGLINPGDTSVPVASAVAMDDVANDNSAPVARAIEIV
ncbi:hypothetical protein THAOC_21950 [Thalassiosira oceanica]|uniref:Uncharacterized protein n=1 Tax=Thalassiosira oceanica TaxID=159749 RepID=K0RVX1_THAOC|nr:hypothetical protein THAOC_21950 [Thalassiosira oceanica]|eukprot:EJK57963.1 hypothetical protein THAOC_21950 [Thalassiosira oceanica]